jgi:hypothetical protein
MSSPTETPRKRQPWSSRLLRPVGMAAAALVALFVLSPPALAQGGNPLSQGPGNPLSPGLPVTPGTTPTVTTPTTTTSTSAGTSGGGLSGSTAVGIGAGALIVLGGISFFIWWDARRRAPVRQRAAAATAAAGAGSRQRTKSRKLSPAERRRRKRGKAR